MPPPQVERRRVDAAIQKQLDPRRASAQEIRFHHRQKRPALEVRSLDAWIERDAPPGSAETCTEVDVFDRGVRKAAFVEAVDAEEGIAPYGAKARPEGRGATRTGLMDVVMQQVAKVGHDAALSRIVVVRAEDRGQVGLGLERPPDPHERVRVHLDVGVDEDENLPARTLRAVVARAGRSATRGLVDDDDLLRRRGGCVNCGQYRSERRRPIGGGDDGAEPLDGSDDMSSPATGRPNPPTG